MINETALKEKLESKTGLRVTEEYMQSRIKRIEFHHLPGTTVTVCNITLDNGYSVRGESACVSPENYDPEIGNHYAKKQAFDKLWPLFGFLLAEQKFRAAEAPRLDD